MLLTRNGKPLRAVPAGEGHLIFPVLKGEIS